MGSLLKEKNAARPGKKRSADHTAAGACTPATVFAKRSLQMDRSKRVAIYASVQSDNRRPGKPWKTDSSASGLMPKPGESWCKPSTWTSARPWANAPGCGRSWQKNYDTIVSTTTMSQICVGDVCN